MKKLNIFAFVIYTIVWLFILFLSCVMMNMEYYYLECLLVTAITNLIMCYVEKFINLWD